MSYFDRQNSDQRHAAAQLPEERHDTPEAEQLFDTVPEPEVNLRPHPLPQDVAGEDDIQEPADRTESMTPSESNRAAAELQRGLLQMYRKQQLTDISIKVGRAVFRCHRVVLCAMSDFFKRLLSEQEDRRLVIVQNVDPSIFEDVLEYIYTGRFIIRDNFGDFLKLIVRMEMSSLAGKMEAFLERHLAPDNCIQVWRHAARMPELRDLEVKAAQYVLTNFFHPDITNQLRELTLPELIHILDDDNLQAENEEMVVRRGLEWLQTRKVRAAEAGRLFERLRLPLTSNEFIRREVLAVEAVRENQTCREVVAEAMTFLTFPQIRHEFHTTRIAFRKSNPDTEVLVVYGGYKFGGAKAKDVVALNLMDKKWHTLASLPHHPGKGMATAVYNNNIYFTGGTRDQKAFWKYISNEDRWEQGPPMLSGRRDHSMEVLPENKICVIGGYGQVDIGEGEHEDDDDDEFEDEPVLKVEILEEDEEGWTSVIDLLLPISHAASCASTDGTKIYLYGGKMADGNATNSLQCLDLAAGTCTLLSTSLPVACFGAVGARTYSAYYLLTTKGEVMKFDINTAKLLSNDKVPHFKRKRFCVACHHDNLVVVGGEDGQQIYRDIVCIRMDESASQLIPLEDFLPPVRSHFGMAKLIVPKESLGEALW